jgi:hypothetical protein
VQLDPVPAINTTPPALVAVPKRQRDRKIENEKKEEEDEVRNRSKMLVFLKTFEVPFKLDLNTCNLTFVRRAKV